MTQRRILASPRRRARQTTAHVAIAAICSVALWSGAGSALASTERDPVVVGDASAIEAGVEVRGGADAPFVLLEAVEPVAVGDGVRTDFTGFAEIAYLDGSRTRLDIDTEFEVVELTDDAGVSTTRTSMGVGRTWHRVESLGEGEFTVETSQATATVRGTAFVLDCVSAGNCSYVVFEGVIEVALGNGSVIEVIGPAKVEVVGGVAGPVIPVTLAELLADPWLVANVKRDIGAGFDDLVTTLGTDEAEPTTTELATTSTTTADTSTTTTEPSTSTTEESTSTTTAEALETTTTEEPETTTTEEPETTTTEPPETTTTEPPETTTTEPPETTTTEPPETTPPPPPTTLPPTTTTVPPRVWPICHRVLGPGNTGNGYDYLILGDEEAARHLVEHFPRDFYWPWNTSCVFGARATATIALTSLPPSTTTTTEPEVVTETARPVVETTPPDSTVTSPPPTPAPAPATTAAIATMAPAATTAPAETRDTNASAEASAPAATAAPAETAAPVELVAAVDPPAPAEPGAAERPAGWSARALWRLGIA